VRHSMLFNKTTKYEINLQKHIRVFGCWVQPISHPTVFQSHSSCSGSHNSINPSISNCCYHLNSIADICYLKAHGHTLACLSLQQFFRVHTLLRHARH
jgi:hypothetical protein